MDLTITPGLLQGTLQAIPSKSQAHRLLICAAFADRPTALLCPATNQDIEATAGCLRALGAHIVRTENGYSVSPIEHIRTRALLDCGESGSTLRFMLPIVGSLGVDATFTMAGRLPTRPLSPLWEEMQRMGCQLSRPTENIICCTGKLHAGDFTIDGSVSSQFITGLLFAMALLPGESRLMVTGKTESKPYIEMTQKALSNFGVATENYHVCGSLPFTSPGTLEVEGDWSNGAFFLAAEALGNKVKVLCLDENSPQGDRAVAEILDALNDHITVDAANIPDLVPILAIVAGAKKGAKFQNIARLRLKESDRVASVAAMLEALGATVRVTADSMTVYPAQYHSCVIDSAGDHRIAMSAAIAATVADGAVTVRGAQCVAKSYPDFWSEYGRLGGNYVQHIR